MKTIYIIRTSIIIILITITEQTTVARMFPATTTITTTTTTMSLRRRVTTTTAGRSCITITKHIPKTLSSSFVYTTSSSSSYRDTSYIVQKYQQKQCRYNYYKYKSRTFTTFMSQQQQLQQLSSLSLSLSDDDSTINEQQKNKQNRIIDKNTKKDTSCLYLPSDIQKEYPITCIVAPMVAASEYAFRSLCRQYNNNNNNQTQTILTYTQMIHSNKIVHDKNFYKCHLDLYEYSNNNNNNNKTNNNNPSSLLPLPSYTSLLPTQKASLLYGDYTFRDTSTTSTTSTKQFAIDIDQQRQELLHQFLNKSNNQQQQQQQQQQYTNTKFTTTNNPQTGPVIVQLAGNDPITVSNAAKFIYNQHLQQESSSIHGFDLNCGCPQGIARKGRYGAHLMEQDESTVYKILESLRQSLPDTVAVTAKIRLPTNRSNKQLLENRIRNIINTGVNYITIHGRTIVENKIAVQEPHYSDIHYAVQIANEYNIPIIANGGIETYNDIETVKTLTGAVGIMSSESLLENPSLFTNNPYIDAIEASTVEDTTVLLQLMNYHFQIVYDYLIWCQLYPPIPGVIGYSMNIIRGHLFKMLFRYLNYYPIYRDELANGNVSIQSINDAQNFVQRLQNHCITSIQQLSYNEVYTMIYSRQASWYRRHWDARTSNRSKIFIKDNNNNRILQFATKEQKDNFNTNTNNNSTQDNCSTTSTVLLSSVENQKLLIKSRIDILRKQRIEKTSSNAV